MAAELAMATLQPDQHLLLDQPLLKVPTELARKVFKTAQRILEREKEATLSALKAAANDAIAHGPGNPLASSDSTNQALASLDNIVSRMEALKRRLESLREEEKALHRQSRARVNYLQELYEIPCVADVKYDEWSKVRLNRLMVDYLLRSGYTDSASSLAKRMGIEDLVDSEAFMQCHRIQASLDKHRTQECLSWCADNKQALKKEKSELEFELRLQQYLELVRTQQPLKLLEATRHARKYFSSHPNSIFAVRAAGLLAYSPNTTVEPYRTLYSSSRWETLKELFVNTYEKLLSLPQQTPLHHALSAGLSALKTPACHSTHLSSSSNANTASGTSVCPICSTELNELARGVPYAHHSKSNVESDPVVLPNGRVYGKERLLNWQGKAVKVEGNGDSWIRDPTNPEEVYEVQQMKKIYFT